MNLKNVITFSQAAQGLGSCFWIHNGEPVSIVMNNLYVRTEWLSQSVTHTNSIT